MRRTCGSPQFLKPSGVRVGEIHGIRNHRRRKLRLAGTVILGATLLLLARTLVEFRHQTGCATLFDGANHLVHRVGGTRMSVCGAHIVDRVGQIDHGLRHRSIAVQFGRGAENGGKLRGIANRSGKMRRIRADVRVDIPVERLLMFLLTLGDGRFGKLLS